MTRFARAEGTSLIEVMIALAVTILVILAGVSLQFTVHDSVRSLQNTSDRDLSFHGVATSVIQQDSMKLNATLLPQNDSIAPCLRGGATPSCSLNCCIANTVKGFTAIDPLDSNPDIASKARIAGPPDSPVYYTKTGLPCPAALIESGGCAYRLTSEYSAHCPSDAFSCDHADYLLVTVSLIPSAGSLIKPEKIDLLHFVKLNYKPSLTPFAAQTIPVTTSVKLSVTPDPGFPDEPKEFIFETCQSSNPAVATAKCYGFIGGTGKIIITGQSVGTAEITVQVNDLGRENSISDPQKIPVTVN